MKAPQQIDIARHLGHGQASAPALVPGHCALTKINVCKGQIIYVGLAFKTRAGLPKPPQVYGSPILRRLPFPQPSRAERRRSAAPPAQSQHLPDSAPNGGSA